MAIDGARLSQFEEQAAAFPLWVEECMARLEMLDRSPGLWIEKGLPGRRLPTRVAHAKTLATSSPDSRKVVPW